MITRQRLVSRLVSLVIWNVGKWLGIRQVRVDVSSVVSAAQKLTKCCSLFHSNICILSLNSDFEFFWFTRWGFEKFILVSFSSGSCYSPTLFSDTIIAHFRYLPSTKLFLFQLFQWLIQIPLFDQIGCLEVEEWNVTIHIIFFSKEEVNQAASRIQAGFRGYQVRKNKTDKEASSCMHALKD